MKCGGGDGNDTYYVDHVFDFLYDSGGTDTAFISTSFVKLPSTIENVFYTDGALALPYWISALLPDEAAGKSFTSLLGESKSFGYIFPTSLPSYDTSATDAKGFTAFSATQKARTVIALSYISTLLDVSFTEKTSAASLNTLSFASNIQTNSGGYSNYPSNDFDGSDLFLDIYSSNTTLADGTYGALTLIHEIGHALGLKHPFSHQQAGNGGVADAPYLTGSEETTSWTVMSYEYSSSEYYLRYSPLDIAALQYLYGPSKSARTGNDKYTISSSSANFIWDGVGTDQIDASGTYQAATIYLTPGYWGFIGSAKTSTITSAGQITVNFGTVIENLIGSNYDDHLYGNAVSNKIEGGNGSDSVEGWDGDDTLLGGAGNDYLTGGSGNDSIEGGDGNDTLVVSGFFSDYIVRYDSTALNYSIEGKSGTDGKDTFKTVEFLKFSDKTVSLQSIDVTPPTIALSSSLSSLATGKIATINLAISESVSDFTLEDIDVSGGALSNFTGIGSTYSATFTPSRNFTGTGSVKVESGKFTDSSGNTNEDGDETNNFTSISIDTQSPVALSYSPVDEGNKVGVASDIVIHFSEIIQKGSGSVLIKTNAGVKVASYDILTSANLTLSGTSLTINPSINLSFDMGYQVDITAGTFKDLFGNEFPALTTYNFTTVSSIIGTAAGEILYGTAYEDNMLGHGGNDTLIGGLGSDLIDGGDGLDTLKFTGAFGDSSFSNYSIKKLSNGNWAVSYSGPVIAIYPPPATDGIDTLVNVERLQFTDTGFALDLDGNAGITAKVIGAVLGKKAVKNPNYVGIGLSYLDKGMSYSDLGALALNAVEASTNDSIVSKLWLNVMGSPASAIEKAPFVKMLSDGMAPGDLVVLAADTVFNTDNIELVGLVQTGIEYTTASDL